MLAAGWTVLFGLLLAFTLTRKSPHERRRMYWLGALVTTLVFVLLHVFTVVKDPLLLAMIFHVPLFFAYAVAFWCHTNLLNSIAETVVAYLVVSLLYLLVGDNALLSLALILSAMGAQWLVTTTYFQMHADDFLYEDAR